MKAKMEMEHLIKYFTKSQPLYYENNKIRFEFLV